MLLDSMILWINGQKIAEKKKMVNIINVYFIFQDILCLNYSFSLSCFLLSQIKHNLRKISFLFAFTLCCDPSFLFSPTYGFQNTHSKPIKSIQSWDWLSSTYLYCIHFYLFSVYPVPSFSASSVSNFLSLSSLFCHTIFSSITTFRYIFPSPLFLSIFTFPFNTFSCLHRTFSHTIQKIIL